MCILIALSVCGLRTVQQNRTWKNNVTLWEHNLKINPDSFIANRNLGNHYTRNGDHERALAYYRELTRAYPELSISWNTSARAARRLQRTGEAIGYYKNAIIALERNNFRSWRLRTEYADYLNAIGNTSEALSEYQAIIAKEPPNMKKLEEKVESLRMRL